MPQKVAAAATQELAHSESQSRAEVRELAGRLIAIAEELLDGPSDGDAVVSLESAKVEFDDRVLAGVARSIATARKRRDRHFTGAEFGEPAWDMLLDLFINTTQGKRIPTTSLCLASGVPNTTALRTIGVLERDGLLQRYQCPDDKRVWLVEMTSQGYRRMRNYLTEGIWRRDMPAGPLARANLRPA